MEGRPDPAFPVAALAASAANAGAGAIAYSAPEKIVGLSYAHGTRMDAERWALSDCEKAGGTECKIAVWEFNNCMGLSIDTNSLAYGYSFGHDAWNADRVNAVCKQYGGTDCKIAARVCDPQDQRQQPYVYFPHNNGE